MKSAIPTNSSDNRSASGTTNAAFRPQLDSGAYRDPRTGARARRDELANKCRRELALIPLTAGRIFVHRVSRVAAGAAAMVTALVVTLIFADPLIFNLSEHVMFSGLEPDLLMIVICSMGAILVIYSLAGFIAERVFEDKMRRAIEAGGDVFAAIDHLNRGPIAEMQRLARRVEGASVSVPLIGVAMCAPLFAFFTLISTTLISTSQCPGYLFHPKGYLQPWLLDNFISILVAILIGTIFLINIGRACRRSHRTSTPPRLLKVMSHYFILPLSIILGLFVLSYILCVVSDTQPIDITVQGALATAGIIAVLGPLSWLMLLVRNTENQKLHVSQ